MNYEFKLPDIGEGLTEGEVVKWHVKEGDAVRENQPLCNVLTDKAEVEIPSPKSGKILKRMAKEGEKVKVHAALVVFELSDGAPAKLPLGSERTQPVQPLAAPAPKPAPAPAPAASAPAPTSTAAPVSATPAVRKLASDMKVDLASIQATGPGGRITEEDVRRAAGTKTAPVKPVAAAPAPAPAPAAPAPKPASAAPAPTTPKPAAAPAGADERVPFIGIRRRTAEKMAESHRTVAAVTHMDEADLTALSALREELKPKAVEKGVKLTYLPFIMRALLKALKEFPNLNAVLDEAGGAVVRKHSYNFGVATSAEQGLVVPVIKGVDGKDLWALAADVNRLAEKVRAGKIEVSELQGGTFTITNIGPIGGLFATPIVNHPEVAILGIMKIAKRPVVKDGAVVVRDMVNLVLTFDHRVLDGAEAAHFMNALVKHLENPRTLL